MNLSGYKLNKLDFKYFKDFISADMRYTDFSDIEVEGLSFRGSSLAYAQFSESVIPKANFIRTYLSFANFYSSILNDSSFIGCNAFFG